MSADPRSGTNPTGPSILLIDDDVELCELMTEFFTRRGLRLETAYDGPRGLARSIHGNHDLLLIDVMLPGLDGFEFLRQLRRRSSVPVIMLTARTAQVDKVKGLDAGADDYLHKPFGPEELLARIRAVLRRAKPCTPVSEILEVNGARLLPGSREAFIDGVPLELTAIEFDLLDFLIRSAGRIVSRSELSTALYQRPASPFDRSIDMHISHLRKKLGGQGGLIQTVRGVGYLFQSPQESVGTQRPDA